MEQIPFTVSARTARLIGHQNFANPEGAIIELVKNCFDADGSVAITLFDRRKQTMHIIDNGTGMTREIIINHWMTIGTDNKFTEQFTPTGRIKAGAKGIGRFALDRLGNTCKMTTKSKDDEILYLWEVEWKRFDEQAKIHEVFATLDTRQESSYLAEVSKLSSNSRFQDVITNNDFSHGTTLEISGLKEEWDLESLQRLFENLEILTPPDGNQRFQMYLFDVEDFERFGAVNQQGFSDYDYRVTATYKKNDKREIVFAIHRNEFDAAQFDQDIFQREDMKQFPFDQKTVTDEYFILRRSFYELMPGFKDRERNGLSETIGDFRFIFFYMKNTMSSDDRHRFHYKEFLGTRTSWLKKWGGIKIFRDNFRVRPYGEVGTPSYDWLLLGERAAQNPAAPTRKYSWRVRPNQVAGVVEISRIANANFDDTSNRAGLQENDSFDLFKNILKGIIKVFEDDKSTINHNLDEFYKERNKDKLDEEQADKFAEGEDPSDDEEIKRNYRLLKKAIRTKNKTIADQNEELALMRAMASAGVLVAGFSHEFESIKNKLNSRSHWLKKNLEPHVSETAARNLPIHKNPYFNLLEIERIDKKIQQWISFSIQLTRKDRRTGRVVNLIEYLNNFKSAWSSLLQERHVTFDVLYNKAEQTSLRTKIIELDLDTIFDNLLTNSIEAFQRNGFSGHKSITVVAGLQGNFIKLSYRDTGPGLSDEIKDPQKIFTPMFSTKKDANGNDIGTGLGMWLLKTAVDYNKGKVEALHTDAGFSLNVFLKKMK